MDTAPLKVINLCHYFQTPNHDLLLTVFFSPAKIFRFWYLPLSKMNSSTSQKQKWSPADCKLRSATPDWGLLYRPITLYQTWDIKMLRCYLPNKTNLFGYTKCVW